PPPTLLYTPSLHDALPIYPSHLLGQVDELDRHLHHLDAPRLSMLVDDRLEVRVDLLPFDEELVELHLAAHTAQRGLGILGRGERSEEHTSELQSRGHLVCR